MSIPRKVQPIADPLKAIQSEFTLLKLGGIHYIIANDEIERHVHNLHLHKRPDAIITISRFLETLPYDTEPKKLINDFYVDSNTPVHTTTAFSPQDQPPHVLNLWRGPTIEPNSAGDASVIFDHIRDIVCRGNLIFYAYVLDFLAHMIQRPENKPGVMLVLVGIEGTGKGLFLRLFERIWSESFLKTNAIDDVVGRFNAALERAYVVLLDEASFAGDKKATDRMKSMITEPTVRVEAKYQPQRTIESFHRYVAATNHEHFAHISPSDRRHLFLFTSDRRVGDYEYFSALADAINDDDCLGKLVDELLQRDISNFRPMELPKDTQKYDQILKSLTGIEEYWYQRLLTATRINSLSEGGLNLPTPGWDGGYFVSSEELLNSYVRHTQRQRGYQVVSAQTLIKKVQALCPSIEKARKDAGSVGSRRGWQLPDLDDARRDFEGAMGFPVDWD